MHPFQPNPSVSTVDTDPLLLIIALIILLFRLCHFPLCLKFHLFVFLFTLLFSVNMLTEVCSNHHSLNPPGIFSTISSNSLQSFLSFPSRSQLVGHTHWQHLSSHLHFPASPSLPCPTLFSPLQHSLHTHHSRWCLLKFSSYPCHNSFLNPAPMLLTLLPFHLVSYTQQSTFLFCIVSTSSLPFPVILPTFIGPTLDVTLISTSCFFTNPSSIYTVFVNGTGGCSC